MTKQPESLRLADALECAAFLHLVERDMIAAELRRLHSLNQELLEALKCLMEWQVKNVDAWDNSAYDHAAKILAKATGEQA